MIPLGLTDTSKVAGLKVSLNSTTANAYIETNTTTLTTTSVSATVKGGTPGYNYHWAVTTSDGIVAVTPSSASTAFRKTNTVAGQLYTGTGRLTVTDSLGEVKLSQVVSINIKRTASATGVTIDRTDTTTKGQLPSAGDTP